MTGLTFATMFSGGELAGVGIRAAGLRHIWGIEYEPAIATVAQANGFDGVICADVLAVDPHTLTAPYALHASPPCVRASQANSSADLNDEGTKEAPLDVAMAGKVAEFIDVLQPRIFTLENVYGYRNFRSFGIITAALTRNGYFWDYDHLNSADYGVPQTRKRLILRAKLGALLPHLPEPEPWVGWYAAIEDLIPTLPASQFAPWQLARLPEFLQSTLVDSAGYPDSDGNTVPVMRDMCEPANVIVSNFERRPMRAFIVQGTSTLDVRQSGEPSAVVVGTVHAKAAMPRAFLVDGCNGRNLDDDPRLTIRQAGEPCHTLEATSQGGRYRAWLSAGRVVAMTPRALARFQSVPDSYILPPKNSLACKVIGNGWPCRMAEMIYRGLLA